MVCKMKIDELIRELEQVKEEHGNLRISSSGDCNPAHTVTVHEEPVKHLSIISDF